MVNYLREIMFLYIYSLIFDICKCGDECHKDTKQYCNKRTVFYSNSNLCINKVKTNELISGPVYVSQQQNKKIPKLFFKDIWGYTINWLNPEDGWTKIRQKLTQTIRQMTIDQIGMVPALTKYGYMKMRIPTELFQFIVLTKLNSTMHPENCKEEWPMYNCIRIKEDGSKGKANPLN